MIADPEPQKSVSSFQGESAIVQSDARRPDFLSVGSSNFLELKRRILRITLQQSELLAGATSYLRRESLIGSPEAFRGAMFHASIVGGLFRAFHRPGRFGRLRPGGPLPGPPRCGDRAGWGLRTHRATAAVPPALLVSAFQSRAGVLPLFFRSCPAPTHYFKLCNTIIALSGLA